MSQDKSPIEILEEAILKDIERFSYQQVIQVSFRDKNKPYDFIAYSWSGEKFTNEKLPEDIAIKKAAKCNMEYFKKKIAERFAKEQK